MRESYSLHWSEDGLLVRDMWPQFLPRIAQDKSLEKLQAHEKLPDNLHDLGAWAYVRRFAGKTSTPYTLLHASEDLNTNDQVREVFIRVQGYVLEANLEPLGDWDGTLAGAPKARQFLTLHGNVDTEPFNAQCDALSRIRDFILRRTHSAKSNQEQNGRIYLHNKVFTKVRPGTNQKSALHPMDDPFDRAKHVDRKWLVTKTIKFGFRDQAGKLKKLSHYAIKPGDFVDVKVYADISTYPHGETTETRVYFSVDRVVRLCAKADLPTVRFLYCGPEASLIVAQRTNEKQAEPEIVEEDDLTFDDEDATKQSFMAIE
ncbi:hypothetical protein EIP86_007992 [Pleurotus ostreatoroseus]|nr:hypothetical protein EIP86_007992 [Pleurotus ostreatoroseus]